MKEYVITIKCETAQEFRILLERALIHVRSREMLFNMLTVDGEITPLSEDRSIVITRSE